MTGVPESVELAAQRVIHAVHACTHAHLIALINEVADVKVGASGLGDLSASVGPLALAVLQRRSTEAAALMTVRVARQCHDLELVVLGHRVAGIEPGTDPIADVLAAMGGLAAAVLRERQAFRRTATSTVEDNRG